MNFTVNSVKFQELVDTFLETTMIELIGYPQTTFQIKSRSNFLIIEHEVKGKYATANIVVPTYNRDKLDQLVTIVNNQMEHDIDNNLKLKLTWEYCLRNIYVWGELVPVISITYKVKEQYKFDNLLQDVFL